MIADPEDPQSELAARAQSGDRSAFDQIMRTHKAAIFRLARRYVGNPDDAYDIVQETFIAAWRAIGRYDRRRPFSVWLRTIMLNKCRDASRRQAVRQRYQSFAWLAGLPAEPTVEPHAQAEAAAAEDARSRRLDAAIAGLPAAIKEPLLLTLVGGLTHQQAADQLGTTTKAIELRIRRARQKLVLALDDTEQPPKIKPMKET